MPGRASLLRVADPGLYLRKHAHAKSSNSSYKSRDPRSRSMLGGVLFFLICLAALLMGCNFAPRYSRPTLPIPAAYKESATNSPQGTNLWQPAQPRDAVLRGRWWEMFGDPELNALEIQASASNQTIAVAWANLLSARAVVRESRAQYFPTVTTTPGVTESQLSSRATQFGFVPGGSSTTRAPFTTYSLPFDATWVPDLWGRIRNTVKANSFEAQATAADLENTRLTVQAEVAVDYFELRAQDELVQVLNATATAYQESLALTQVRFQTGIASEQDVTQASTQLDTTLAQATGLAIQRAQFEHAIAVLTGRSPSTFSIAAEPLKTKPPGIPSGVPSQLLERRPDIAAAERRVAEANAQIGVANAAYFPTLTLTGSAGFQSTSLSDLITWPSAVWSVGSTLAETIFDAGLRGATVAQFRAAHERTVAQYRQTVLTGFQQVEDNLASLRILARQLQQQETAVTSSGRNLALATERYTSGIDSYLNVLTAQTTLLANRQTQVSLRLQQLTASVQLVEALGGGWDVDQLPKR